MISYIKARSLSNEAHDYFKVNIPGYPGFSIKRVQEDCPEKGYLYVVQVLDITDRLKNDFPYYGKVPVIFEPASPSKISIL